MSISKKKIAIINQDSGYLMIDICNKYCEENYDVSLITGRLVERSNKLNNSVRIIRIIRYNRNTKLYRLLTWGIGSIQILLVIWFKLKKYELLIVSNPPVAPLLSLLCKNRCSILIYDIYPDALIEMGYISKKSIFSKFWEYLNKKTFKKGINIITISESMKDVLKTYSNGRNIKIIPIWTDNDYLKPIEKDKNPFVINNGLLNKFIVMYSGNLGFSHDIESIVELAKMITYKDIIFIIIGEGEKKIKIESLIKNNKLDNCLLMPYQDVTILPYSLSSADLGIVTTAVTTSKLSIPSKTYNLMSVGVPVMGIADERSALFKLINKYDFGKCFKSEELNNMASFIVENYNDKEKHAYYQKQAINASKKFGVENVNKFVKYE